MSEDELDARLVEEAIRVYRRYAVEIVEGFVFCPYAEKARQDGETKELVLTGATPSDEEVLEVVDRVIEEEVVEIGLLLLPRVEISRPELGRWVEGLRKAHAARHGRTIMAIEGFHPVADADLSSAERLTPFVRRTPDPTLQLTRLTGLERIRRGTPQGTGFFDPETMDVSAFLEEPQKRPLHERISDMNHDTVVRLGVAEIEARMEDILRDRDRAYAAIDPSISPRFEG